VNLGTRVDGEPFRACRRKEHGAAPKHIGNCLSCAGFGHLILREGPVLPVTAAEAREGQPRCEGAQLVRCAACGSDIRGIAGRPEQPANLRLICPRCGTQMQLAAKDLARCPKCGLESVKVESGA
jgi:Zn finger protein HypA/HybF involved in hydrogenase expression